MKAKDIFKTLLVFIGVFLLVALIYFITIQVLVTIFNSVYSSVENDAERMTKSIITAFPLYVILYSVIFFITKYRLIIDKLAEMKRFEGVVPSDAEIRQSCIKSKQNMSEIIAYFIFIALLVFIFYTGFDILLRLVIVVVMTAVFAALDIFIDIRMKKKWIANRLHI